MSGASGGKRIGIIYDTDGKRLGTHGLQFAFKGLPGVEVVALADRNRGENPAFAECGAKRRYEDWHAMIEQERPDIAVLVSRLPEEHDEQIRFALQHGCHVLCEKPLASDLRRGDELVRLAAERHLGIQVAHLARFAPAFRQMKRMLAGGAMGRLLSCHLRGKEDPRGGGEDMLVLGTHLLDVSVFLFGNPVEVMADVRCDGRPVRPGELRQTREPVGLCAGDEVFARFRYENGMTATFESQAGLVPLSDEVRMGLVVACTKGALAVRYKGQRQLRIARDFPIPIEDEAHFEDVPPDGAENDGLSAYPYHHYDTGNPVLRYFAENNRRAAWNLLEAMDGRAELVSPASEALKSLEMIFGVYQSSLERRTVSFPLVNREHPLQADMSK